MPTLAEKDILNALKQVIDPDLDRDIVSLGFVKNLKICGPQVSFEIELTTPACPMKDRLKQQAQAVVGVLPGVKEVNIRMTAHTRGRTQPASEMLLRGVKNVVAVASGKGGVGKSSTTANLALALSGMGAKVGVLDADVYGPSIPAMFGCTDRPEMNAQQQAIPPEAFGIKLMSVAMLVDGDAPVIWRGPIATRVLQQFLGAVAWGELDYLLLDLPPGTGDVQLTLAQSAPLNGAVIVTTPQDVALRIAKKGLKMFETVQVPILGIIENMSGFVCPNCKTVHNIFRQGGGEKIAHELNVPFLGRVPLDPRMVEAGDAGRPLVSLDPESPSAKAIVEIARNMAARLSVSNIKDQEVHCHPKTLHLLDKQPPQIVWEDGATTTYEAHELRAACPCAECRDEMSGERTLRECDVPVDIKLVDVRPVGRYGLNLVFSDGHSSGIYMLDTLRKLGEKA